MRDHDCTNRTFRLCGLLLVVTLCSPSFVSGQRKKPDERKKPNVIAPKTGIELPVTKSMVAAKIREIQGNAKLKDDVKKQILKTLTDTSAQVESAETSKKRLAAFETLQKGVKESVAATKKEIEKPIEDPDPDLSGKSGLTEYETLLAAAKKELTAAGDAKTALETDQKTRRDRQTEVPNRLVEARKELQQVETTLNDKTPSSDPRELVDAQRLLLLAKRDALNAEIKELTAELPAYETTSELLLLQIKAAKLRVQRAERAVQFWTKLVERSRGDEADRQERAVRNWLQRARQQGYPESIFALGERNLRLARRRTESNGTVARLKQSAAELETVGNDLKRLLADKKALEEKLKIPGVEDVIGPELLILRRRIPNVGQYQRKIAARSPELTQVRLTIMRTERQGDEIRSIVSQAEKIVDAIRPRPGKAERANLMAAVKVALTDYQKLNESLSKDHENLHKNLVELNSKQQELINASAALHQIIDKHLLWIPSTTPIGMEHFPAAKEAIERLINPAQWIKVGEVLWASVRSHPFISALAIFLLALVLLRETRLKNHLRDCGRQAANGFTEPYTLTLQALMLSVVLSLTWSATLWFIGWHLESFSGTTGFASAVGQALQTASGILFSLEFLRRVFGRHGLADAHFRWQPAKLRRYRIHLRWFAPVVLLGVFVFTIVEEWGIEDYETSLGRFCLMGLLLVGSAFLATVLRKPKPVATSTLVSEVHTAADRQRGWFRVALYFLVVLFPVALTLLAGHGYFYTATLLTKKLTHTVWLAVTVVILNAMAMRWLYHARGKLAIERVQAAAAAAAAVAAADPTIDPEVQTPLPPPKDPIPSTAADLATINSQTKRLLRILVATSTIIGMWVIWREVLPALTLLEYPLWTSTDEAKVISVFTLGHAIMAISIVVVAFIAAVNIPGFLEVSILQKLPIDSGSRYAASSIARYGIYIIGIVWAFNLAGIGWGKVQWLVAALSVGIGFGLQEIVANFISGLILLFERPLRVGDVVTVGEVTGTVTRIQIRATTVRNWDRKEFIIPNKDLMTGKFMNWTLSDTVNRIVINVGVAYGSDADQVQRILLETVKSHPDSLESPSPIVTFEAFGDSSLNFTIRCYLASVDQRLPTIHQLNAEIQRRLAEAGIEIPFPQRDLHIRTDETSESRHVPKK